MADGGSHSIASLLVTSEFCDQLMLSKALIAALVVLVGVILGTAHVRQQNRIESVGAKIVPMPLIGSSTAQGHQGPWPECVGMSAEECKALIAKKAPDVSIQIIPEGFMVTMDFRLDRVRIFVNDDQEVVSIPSRG